MKIFIIIIFIIRDSNMSFRILWNMMTHGLEITDFSDYRILC